MNNKQYQQIIDEVYEKHIESQTIEDLILIYTKKAFINKIKTEEEFSERWGLKIKERELSLKERLDIWTSLHNDRGYDENTLNDPERAHMWLDTAGVNMRPIPRRVTMVTYKNRTIESYE